MAQLRILLGLALKVRSYRLLLPHAASPARLRIKENWHRLPGNSASRLPGALLQFARRFSSRMAVLPRRTEAGGDESRAKLREPPADAHQSRAGSLASQLDPDGPVRAALFGARGFRPEQRR